jgi:hypothetical protein
MELASLETIEENMCAQRYALEQGFIRGLFLVHSMKHFFLLFSGHFGRWVFISLTKRGDTGYNKWLNKVALNYTLGWMPGEPSQPGEECAILL